jgi:hypothetical protein
MTKVYKRKRLIELNSSDAPSLDKRTKRAFEQSDRNSAKKHIKVEIENLSIDIDRDDEYYELELEMAEICYELEKLDPSYRCTCPNSANFELTLEHINYLNSEIIRINNGKKS